jgi:hypothetical protein
MKDALEQHFANVSSEARSIASCLSTLVLALTPLSSRRKLKVLVPGAGLGRLAYDVAKMGMIQSRLLLFVCLTSTNKASRVRGMNSPITCF